jgi:hypothetical protein
MESTVMHICLHKNARTTPAHAEIAASSPASVQKKAFQNRSVAGHCNLHSSCGDGLRWRLTILPADVNWHHLQRAG